MSSPSGFSARLRSLRARFLRREADDEVRGMAEFLSGVPLFAPLSQGMLLDLAEAVHVRTFRRDEVIYHERDPGIGLYVIESGTVRIRVEDDDGDVREVRTAESGEILGTSGVLGEGFLRRRETAVATCDTRLFGVFSPEFRTLQRRHPKTGVVLAGLLARHAALVVDELHTMLAERSDPIAAARAMNESGTRALERLGEDADL